MKNMMEYRDYFGSVEYSNDDETFYGKVAFVRALISYEGETVKELKQAFRESVDDYLKLCRQQGKKPEQPFKGTFNVRTGPELHRKAAIYAESHNTNLNQVVKEALENFIEAS